MKAAIVGIEGPELSPGEIALLQARPAAGVILFARNIEGRMPLARLVGDLREVLPPGAVLLVDQEGGRVARLGPPDWGVHPSAAEVGALGARDLESGERLAWLTGALIGMDCAEAGFDVVCAPVLDVRAAGMTEAIGDRSFGAVPKVVSAMGQAMADGLLSAGVQPVGKHVPGHGQAQVDSHVGLPRVPADADLTAEMEVFTQCVGMPWMMTAHIVYEALDGERPATVSPIVIEGVIRTSIGFDGVLVSDDLAMGALCGPADQRAGAAIAAGCDLVLHCSGVLAETAAVLASVPDVTPATRARMQRGRVLADRCRMQLDRAMLMADRARLWA